ncbi:unnamed protein product [Paramecium octaurelia]|uniref:Uncharacterized protein n=1 Tax=Paramecium octaurelia TaxID=43137 RepID=A0A8S1V6D7_PAROT|nr:unnamed protein product [Paramecium octaurelia]
MILIAMRYQRPQFHASQVVKNAIQRRKDRKNVMQEHLERLADKLEYKAFPYHVTHYDPAHEDYIPAQRQDYKQRLTVDTHNMLVDGVKRDVTMQRQVDEAIKNLDRPYLKGKSGVTKNITGGLRDYFPIDMPYAQTGNLENEELEYENVFRNEKRWIAQTIAPRERTESEKRHEKELESRPVTRKFHPDKGSKYDVETPYHLRFPYLADRLGHPEFLANPFQRLFRLESDMYHPSYNDQPFVQHPSADPDPTLNFEEGEVVYENTRLREWLKFVWWTGTFSFAWICWVLPYNIVYKTNLMFDHQIDASFYPYHLQSIYNMDYMRINVLAATAASAYLWYFHHMSMNDIGRNYVTKVQYSKDKELVFVTRMGSFGVVREDVFETHHLEVLPYYTKSGVQNMRQNDLGMYEVSCLNKQELMYLYKEDAFWNPNLKTQFLSNHSQLISKQYFGLKRNEEQEYQKTQTVGELPLKDLPAP